MGSFGNIHNASGNVIIVPSPWPEGLSQGDGQPHTLALKSGIAYCISNVNANLTISLDTTNLVYTNYEARYNMVFEYVSGTLTVPTSSVHWNVDWSTFTLDANTWYEIDFKIVGSVTVAVIVKYES